MPHSTTEQHRDDRDALDAARLARRLTVAQARAVAECLSDETDDERYDHGEDWSQWGLTQPPPGAGGR